MRELFLGCLCFLAVTGTALAADNNIDVVSKDFNGNEIVQTVDNKKLSKGFQKLLWKSFQRNCRWSCQSFGRWHK